MATRKKAEPAEELMELIPPEAAEAGPAMPAEDPEDSMNPINGPLPDRKDAEIARLKAELEAANRRAAYTTPMDERKRILEMAEEAAAEGKDPWGILVEIRVPKRAKTEDPWFWININGRSAQIPADDRIQEMKLPFAVVLLDMLTAEERAQDYADSLEVKDPVHNPH